MRVVVTTKLKCSLESAWREVQKPDLLQRIAAPMAVFRPASNTPLPKRWQQLATYFVDTYLFGFLPIGRHRLFMEKIDHEKHEILTRESDPLVKKWDHTLAFWSDADGTTRYSDTIDIDAGVLTVLVAAWAAIFYRHRQRKWRRLAPSLA